MLFLYRGNSNIIPLSSFYVALQNAKSFRLLERLRPRDRQMLPPHFKDSPPSGLRRSFPASPDLRTNAAVRPLFWGFSALLATVHPIKTLPSLEHRPFISWREAIAVFSPELNSFPSGHEVTSLRFLSIDSDSIHMRTGEISPRFSLCACYRWILCMKEKSISSLSI
jgi:hypothetical protein